MPLGWSLLIVPLLIGLNAFLVASEYAVVAIREAQLESLRRRGWHATAAAVEQLQSNPASAIGTIQICITMTNLLLGWIGEPAMSALLLIALRPLGDLLPEAAFRSGALVLSFVIVTLVTVVFSELLPKALTLRYAGAAAVLTAVTVRALRHGLRPLVWLMTATANMITRPLGLGGVDDLEKQEVTLEELRLLAARAADAGVLTPRGRSLVLNSLTLGGRRAREIMVPRVRVCYLDVRRLMEENRRVAEEHLFSRLPLCIGSLDHVVGVVHTKEFLTAYHPEGNPQVLTLIAHPPVFVPEQVPLERLLEELRRNRTQLVFLVDEYGGVEGIVTLQDVVDELLGEFPESRGGGLDPA